MKTGDQVALVIKEAGKIPRWVMKELVIDGTGALAITPAGEPRDWPDRLRLRPELLEKFAMPYEHPALYFYQPDVVKP